MSVISSVDPVIFDCTNDNVRMSIATNTIGSADLSHQRRSICSGTLFEKITNVPFIQPTLDNINQPHIIIEDSTATTLPGDTLQQTTMEMPLNSGQILATYY